MLPCAPRGVAVFLAIHPVAVTVFEIQTEVFDPLATEFSHNVGVELLRERKLPVGSQDACEFRRIWAKSLNERNATSPSFAVESALKRWAPP